MKGIEPDTETWIWVLDKAKKYIRCFIDKPDKFMPQNPIRELLPPDVGVWHYAEGFQSYFNRDEYTHWPCVFEIWEIEV